LFHRSKPKCAFNFVEIKNVNKCLNTVSVKDPVGSFQLVDAEYEKMSDSHKINMMYDTRMIGKGHETKQEWTLLKGREAYEVLFRDILKDIEQHVLEHGRFSTTVHGTLRLC